MLSKLREGGGLLQTETVFGGLVFLLQAEVAFCTLG